MSEYVGGWEYTSPWWVLAHRDDDDGETYTREYRRFIGRRAVERAEAWVAEVVP